MADNYKYHESTTRYDGYKMPTPSPAHDTRVPGGPKPTPNIPRSNPK